jgi:hypothetical protein
MTAHELARKLLDGPDLVVCKLTTTVTPQGGNESFDEISEIEPMKDTFFRDPSIVSSDQILQRDAEFLFIF